MPLYRITKEDFPRIDWPAVKSHVHSQLEVIQTELFLFASQLLGLKTEIFLGKNAIVCKFWIDPDSFVLGHTHYRRKRWYSDSCWFCQRPVLKNPKRFVYFSKYENKMIEDFLKSAGSAPWINLKAVRIREQSKDGLLTIHFKVCNYEPFLIQT